MSGKKENDPAYVTRRECTTMMQPLASDVKTMKNAMVGEDLQGGFVKTINDMKIELANLKNIRKMRGRDWAYLIVGLAGVFGTIFAALLFYFKP